MHTHPSSAHFESLALCFLASANRAEDPHLTPASVKVIGLSGEVTVRSKAAELRKREVDPGDPLAGPLSPNLTVQVGAITKIIIFPMFLDAAPNTTDDLFCPSRAGDSILFVVIFTGLGEDMVMARWFAALKTFPGPPFSNCQNAGPPQLQAFWTISKLLKSFSSKGYYTRPSMGMTAEVNNNVPQEVLLYEHISSMPTGYCMVTKRNKGDFGAERCKPKPTKGITDSQEAA
eukprot:Em0010g691a